MATTAESGSYWKRRPALNSGIAGRRFRRRAFIAGVGGIAAGLAVGACGDDNGGTTATQAPAGQGATATKEPKKGGTFISAAAATGLHYDQHQLPGIAGDGNVYNTLLKLGDGQALMPDLAEKWETPEPNVYIFHLRPGVKFQNIAPVNGRAMTAQDVVYSVNRANTNNPAFSNRWMWTTLTSIEAPDPNTVKATFNGPFAPALFHFAAASMTVIAKEVVDQFGDLKDSKSRIGTGPFILKEVRKDELYSYRRNPDYFDAKLPYMDGIDAPVIPDRLARTVALRTGQVDNIPFQDGVTDLEEAKRGMSDVTFETKARESLAVLAFNHASGQNGDERVRRAISLAVDHQALIRAAGGEGAGVVKGFVHPNGSPWALPDSELAQLTKQDLTEAKRLMSSAGQDAGFSVSITVSSTDTTGVDVVSVLQQQLQKINIKLTLDMQEYASYIRKLSTKAFELIFVNGWTPALDPSQQFHGSLRSDAAQNWWNAKVPEVNALDDKQLAELDNTKRAALVQDLERLNFQKVVALPLYVPNGWGAYKNYVHDLDFQRPANGGGWQNSLMWLDK
jgi:ABC-type transport system substrate-binding protein